MEKLTKDLMIDKLYRKYCDELDVKYSITLLKELKLQDLNMKANRNELKAYYDEIFNKKIK